MASRRYVPLYHDAPDDASLESIYDDDHHWATYCRLRIAADTVWPQSAAIPVGTRSRSVTALASVGLIELQGRDRFRMPGVDADREALSSMKRDAAAVRWHSTSNAPALHEQSTSNAPLLTEQNVNRNTTRTPSVGSRGGAMRSFKDLMADFKP